MTLSEIISPITNLESAPHLSLADFGWGRVSLRQLASITSALTHIPITETLPQIQTQLDHHHDHRSHLPESLVINHLGQILVDSFPTVASAIKYFCLSPVEYAAIALNAQAYTHRHIAHLMNKKRTPTHNTLITAYKKLGLENHSTNSKTPAAIIAINAGLIPWEIITQLPEANRTHRLSLLSPYQQTVLSHIATDSPISVLTQSFSTTPHAVEELLSRAYKLLDCPAHKCKRTSAVLIFLLGRQAGII